MKKIVSLALVLMMGLIVFTSATPKKKKKAKVFKGKITYAITYDGDGMTPVQKSKAPKTLAVKVFGTMSSVEIVDGPVIITMIERPDENVKITMIEIMDKKGGITQIDSTSSDSAEQYTTEIDYSDDTKEIAGYVCKKAVVTFTPKEGVEDEEQTLIIYYCPDLGGAELNTDGPYKGVPGRILEYYQVAPGVIAKFTATEVKKGGVSELVDFYFNADFKEFQTQEELREYFQG